MRNLTPKQASQAMVNATANQYRIHWFLAKSAFNALNVFKKAGDLEKAEHYRQVCLQSYYTMKDYEIKLLKGGH